jgi:hypothetical protein
MKLKPIKFISETVEAHYDKPPPHFLIFFSNDLTDLLSCHVLFY